MMKSVLVAGGAGFVGSHLVDRLLRRADIARLVVVDNLWSGQLDNLSHIRDPRFHFERCDFEALQSPHLFDEIYQLTGRPITIYGDGLQSRSWGYIDDIIEGFERFFWRDTFDYQGPAQHRQRPRGIGDRGRAPCLQAGTGQPDRPCRPGTAGPDQSLPRSDAGTAAVARVELYPLCAWG